MIKGFKKVLLYTGFFPLVWNAGCALPSLALKGVQGLTQKKSAAKFFDIDKNGSLNLYEQNLFMTHKLFKWELADTKRKKEFDNNQNYMLEPFEWEQYQKAKEAQKRAFRPVKMKY